MVRVDVYAFPRRAHKKLRRDVHTQHRVLLSAFARKGARCVLAFPLSPIRWLCSVCPWDSAVSMSLTGR